MSLLQPKCIFRISTKKNACGKYGNWRVENKITLTHKGFLSTIPYIK